MFENTTQYTGLFECVIQDEEAHIRQKTFNVTMIFITHEQEEAFFLSDRVMVMSEGKIEQLDSPQAIYNNPANPYIKRFVVDHLDAKLESLKRTTGKSTYE